MAQVRLHSFSLSVLLPSWDAYQNIEHFQPKSYWACCFSCEIYYILRFYAALCLCRSGTAIRCRIQWMTHFPTLCLLCWSGANLRPKTFPCPAQLESYGCILRASAAYVDRFLRSTRSDELLKMRLTQLSGEPGSRQPIKLKRLPVPCVWVARCNPGSSRSDTEPCKTSFKNVACAPSARHLFFFET
jgi:hypothetical protein